MSASCRPPRASSAPRPYFMTSAKLMASSMPGIAVAISCSMDLVLSPPVAFPRHGSLTVSSGRRNKKNRGRGSNAPGASFRSSGISMLGSISCTVASGPTPGLSPCQLCESALAVALKGGRTIAKRLVKPFTGVGALVNFWLNASERLCAGSVEMSRTDGRTCAS